MHQQSSSDLSQEEIVHYSRHLIMPEIGMEGQRKLKNAAVLIVGAGGLGSPLAQYLAAAGIGKIGIVEFDHVDASNLHRQVIYSIEQVGKSKLECAQQRLSALNPHIYIEPYNLKLSSENALDIIAQYDVVVDGTDNFPTRYLINDACVLLGKPNVYASIFRFEGQLSVFATNGGPCYRCLYPEPPPQGMVPSCAEGGVLGVLPGIMGTLQANEVIKLVLGIGDSMVGRLLSFDALAVQFREFKLHKDHNCLVCSDHATQKELVDYVEFCGLDELDGYGDIEQLSPSEVYEAMNKGAPVTLVDIRSDMEFQISHIDGAVHIPLENLHKHFNQIDPASKVVCQCYMGKRSLQAAKVLKELGFEDVVSLKGGILGWNEEVDSSVLRY